MSARIRAISEAVSQAGYVFGTIRSCVTEAV